MISYHAVAAPDRREMNPPVHENAYDYVLSLPLGTLHETSGAVEG